MPTVDTLIHCRWIAPVEPDTTIYEYHSLAIREGRILEILPTDSARTRYRAAIEHELDRHLLIPGLVNAHTLSLIHISEPTRQDTRSRMPSSA